MDLKDWIYTIMAVSQIMVWGRVRLEAMDCGWTRQSRWIYRRIMMVIIPILMMTVAAGWLFTDGDAILDWVLAAGLASMTLIIILRLPEILESMSDEQVGEDLNVRMNDNEY